MTPTGRSPAFHRAQRVELLIGASLFFELLSVGQIQLEYGLRLVQKTRFGLVISGDGCTPGKPRVASSAVSSPLSSTCYSRVAEDAELLETGHLLDDTGRDRTRGEIDSKRLWKENKELKNCLVKKSKVCSTAEGNARLYESCFNELANADRKKITEELIDMTKELDCLRQQFEDTRKALEQCSRHCCVFTSKIPFRACGRSCRSRIRFTHRASVVSKRPHSTPKSIRELHFTRVRIDGLNAKTHDFRHFTIVRELEQNLDVTRERHVQKVAQLEEELIRLREEMTHQLQEYQDN
ncbi:lamin Dm0-like [Drosophila eugracilis]|uniref:lamin Dm0-like n=1 Tax=Drosophila eugracilis TaxID=29029 RepID=UPI001BD97C8E|nr:lamin Dm0-like [Drosophila eugracilis]